MPTSSPQRYQKIDRLVIALQAEPSTVLWLSLPRAAIQLARSPARPASRASLRKGRSPRATRSRLIQERSELSIVDSVDACVGAGRLTENMVNTKTAATTASPRRPRAGALCMGQIE